MKNKKICNRCICEYLDIPQEKWKNSSFDTDYCPDFSGEKFGAKSLLFGKPDIHESCPYMLEQIMYNQKPEDLK